MAWTLLDHESFFHAIMATIPSSILILDQRLAVLTVNHNFLEKSRTSLSSISGGDCMKSSPPLFRTPRSIGISARSSSPAGHCTVSAWPIGAGRFVAGLFLQHLPAAVARRITRGDPGDGRRDRSLATRRGSAANATASGRHRRERGRPHHLHRSERRHHDLERRCGESRRLHASGSARLRARRPHRRPQNLEVQACFRGIAQIDDRRSVEWPMRCRNGESIPVSWRLSRMTGTTGEVTGVVVVGRNLVEQRAMEAQIRQGEKLAALGMVIGGIAHEIRNPLGVSSAAAQLMRDRIARRPCSKSASEKSSPASTGRLSSSKACCVSPDPGRSRRRRRSMCSTC